MTSPHSEGPTQSRGSTATAGAGSGGAAAASGGALKDKNGPAASGGGSGSGSGSSTAASGGGLSKLLCGIVSCISDPWRSGLLIREGDVLEVLDTGPENAGTSSCQRELWVGCCAVWGCCNRSILFCSGGMQYTSFFQSIVRLELQLQCCC